MQCQRLFQHQQQNRNQVPAPLVVRHFYSPHQIAQLPDVVFWVDRWSVSTKNYWRVQALNSDRRVMIKKAKDKTNKVGHELKRLQRRKMWRMQEKRRERRIEMANRFEKRQERREVRMRTRRMVLHTPTCKLWTCQRQRGIRDEKNCERLADFRRRRMKRCTSRISVLSDLSARSRTPILSLRSSPFLNDRGFQTEYNV